MRLLDARLLLGGDPCLAGQPPGELTVVRHRSPAASGGRVTGARATCALVTGALVTGALVTGALVTGALVTGALVTGALVTGALQVTTTGNGG